MINGYKSENNLRVKCESALYKLHNKFYNSCTAEPDKFFYSFVPLKISIIADLSFEWFISWWFDSTKSTISTLENFEIFSSLLSQQQTPSLATFIFQLSCKHVSPGISGLELHHLSKSSTFPKTFRKLELELMGQQDIQNIKK